MSRTKPLKYTLVAEGYAEYAFIPAYLRRVALEHEIQAVPSKLGFKGQKAGKSKVIQEAGAICTIAIQQDHPLILVGVDLDAADHEREQPKHTSQCQELMQSLGRIYKKYESRIVIFVTVQAIEQWLAYQAYQSKLTDTWAPNSLESKSQHELKRLLYGEKENGIIMARIAEKTAASADFDELAKQSRSFNHFHKQITAFLNEYNKT